VWNPSFLITWKTFTRDVWVSVPAKPWFVSLNTVSLAHKKLASARTASGSHCAQVSYKRNSGIWNYERRWNIPDHRKSHTPLQLSFTISALNQKQREAVTRLRTGRSGVPIPTRVRAYSLLHRRPHRLWGKTKLLFNGYRGSFQGIKRSERNVNHSPPSSAQLRMSGAVPLLHPYTIMLWIGATLLLLVTKYKPMTTRSTRIILNWA
jgi:hypothetical protein